MEINKLNKIDILTTLGVTAAQFQIETMHSVTSTNDVVKPLYQQAPEKISLVAATHQTAGRGRQGKSFYSELQDGLYFSLALQPNTKNIEDIPLYTLLTATALGLTLEQTLPKPIAIKWVNDIFYKQRKVGGILSEMMPSLENDDKPAIVIGIGINLAGSFESTDQGTQAVAGTVFGNQAPADFNKGQFLGQFLKHFLHYHQTFHQKEFMRYYEERLMGRGQQVFYEMQGEVRVGVIVGIDGQGHLRVRQADGTVEVLYGQDVHFGSGQFARMDE